MAKTQLTEPQDEHTTTATRTREEWHVCSGCLRSRRVEGGFMIPHRAWVPALQEMVACPGAGQPAAGMT